MIELENLSAEDAEDAEKFWVGGFFYFPLKTLKTQKTQSVSELLASADKYAISIRMIARNDY